jgi:hypothetical protein
MTSFSLNSTRRRAVLGLSLLLGIVAACSSESIRPIGLPAGRAILPTDTAVKPSGETNPGNTAAPKQGDDAKSVVAPEPLTFNIVDLTSSDRKRKTSEQLQKSIILCLGSESQSSPAAGGSSSPANMDVTIANPAILKISADMIVTPGAAALTEGRVRFLLQDSTTSKVDKNIVELERGFLDSSSVASTGTYADTLEDAVYLNSLLTVASVAAFNCDVRSASNTNCNCSTQAAASAMLQRCLPQFDPNTDAFKDTLEKLASVENCGAPESSADGLLKRRRAIASLLSSYAFATAK